jgi:ATP adenylyltransferase
MDRLWTPWRMSYVSGIGDTPQGEGSAKAEKKSACFLCDIIASPERDDRNLVLWRGERCFVLLNLYPYNTGHLMVVPYTHSGDITTLSTETGHALFDLTQRTVAALRDEYKPDSFNVGLNLGRSAGAGLPDHLHAHVVPRWSGDTNFMTVVGETKVLPEALDQTWARLKPRFG